jgi:tRNA-(ms[2]io[6]A)-hydroxylase
LADFYGSLFESEARHYATYMALAEHFAPSQAVADRLAELAEREAEIIALNDDPVRVHS